MTTAELSIALQQAASGRAYIRRLEILDQTTSLLKARLLITSHLFVQFYRNDRFDTTNLALIYNGRRVYGRDQLGGRWHRHPIDFPDRHDRSVARQRAVELAEFLDEIEDILATMDLP